MLTSKFEKLCKRFGYKLVPIASKINDRKQRRADIQGVSYHGDFIMVVLKKIMAFPNRYHTDFNGIQHPDYFQCEKTLYYKTFSLKNDYGKAL